MRPPKGARGQQEWGASGSGGSHIQQWVVDENNFAEVEFVGEPLPFGLVQNPLVIVVTVGERTGYWGGAGEG